MNNHPWYQHCLSEIDRALNNGRRSRRLSDWERSFLRTARERIQRGIGLSDKQEESLRRLYSRMTDPVRI